VSMDLCLASMPGAFVFEPADSVEVTKGGGRARAADLAAPASAHDAAFVADRPASDVGLRRAEPRAERRARHAPVRRPASARDLPPPSSEDPH
ncbi:MAG TPA: hypothetical protein VNN07_04655, partial [Candidatus Tectomicrobia bacterium]|nr:hypothetical protein [Candidatus Tectomicrobia bacterium]